MNLAARESVKCSFYFLVLAIQDGTQEGNGNRSWLSIDHNHNTRGERNESMGVHFRILCIRVVFVFVFAWNMCLLPSVFTLVCIYQKREQSVEYKSMKLDKIE